jgi:hypothetical protein
MVDATVWYDVMWLLIMKMERGAAARLERAKAILAWVASIFYRLKTTRGFSSPVESSVEFCALAFAIRRLVTLVAIGDFLADAVASLGSSLPQYLQ